MEYIKGRLNTWRLCCLAQGVVYCYRSNNMIDFSRELNPEQLDVVLHGDGPCLVLAGAGSGKTRTITYRVAYLLENGVKPENILLVTFTNKAAKEMVKRVQELMGRVGTNSEGGAARITLPWAGTFHHIAYRVLKRYAPVIGYKSNFSILDSEDSATLIRQCIKEVKTGAEKKFPSANAVQAIISFARNAEIPLQQVIENKFYQWSHLSSALYSIAADYEKRKKEANVMDFDDLLVNFLRLLSDSSIESGLAIPPYEGGARNEQGGVRLREPTINDNGMCINTLGSSHPPTPLTGGSARVNAVLKKFSSQFQYILVDEYQDTNKIQASIIKKLSSTHNNVLVVGDDAQSIYSFRAADIENILRFSAKGGSAFGGEGYENAKIFLLTTNYRSTEEILDLANDVIAKNVRQYPKNLRTLAKSDLRPALYPQMDQSAEAEFIVGQINKLLNDGRAPNDIAVLFRAAHHSQMLELELVKCGIAYDYRGGLRFFERAHIKDVLAYLRIMNNLSDTAAWFRVLLREEGIGPAGAQKIVGKVKDIDNIEGIRDIGYSLFGEKARLGWGNFVSIWDAIAEVDRNPSRLIEAVLNSAYKDYLESEFLDSKERLEDIKQLMNFAQKQDDLEQFLAEASLHEGFHDPSLTLPLKGEEPTAPPLFKEGEGGGRIILSTIHQAKGLEWDAVFIINLSNGNFPNERAASEKNGLEEERRLFYVAITRARWLLYLTYPMASRGFGEVLAGPSMFLSDIDSSLLDDHSLISSASNVFNDSDEISYISEDQPLRLKPGSFLKSIEDL